MRGIRLADFELKEDQIKQDKEQQDESCMVRIHLRIANALYIIDMTCAPFPSVVPVFNHHTNNGDRNVNGQPWRCVSCDGRVTLRACKYMQRQPITILTDFSDFGLFRHFWTFQKS